MKSRTRIIVLEFDPTHRGAYRWSAHCPTLPGCVTDGRTRAEALKNIREAIQGWMEADAKGHPTRVPRVEIVKVVA